MFSGHKELKYIVAITGWKYSHCHEQIKDKSCIKPVEVWEPISETVGKESLQIKMLKSLMGYFR